MKKGRASKTAELVCMGRAMAHGLLAPGRFDDPTAIVLLPEAAAREVRNERSGRVPEGFRARLRHEYLQTQAKMMVARTVAIDDVVRSAGAPQVVILGAGLDGRAWRMPELGQVSVFEVDHPDSQRDKRERVQQLSPASCDIRFVPVDFEHDALAQALAHAGHDETRPTTWIWEGVVMYLTQGDIEATLAVVQQRSAPGSRIVIAYHVPALILKVVGAALRRLGEPLRSAFRPEQMRALLERYGFRVSSDQDLSAIGYGLSPEIGKAAGRVKHMHVVTAERVK
ncbi:MAG: SAM-dependent methyltransferase [Myxococcales bacterium]